MCNLRSNVKRTLEGKPTGYDRSKLKLSQDKFGMTSFYPERRLLLLFHHFCARELEFVKFVVSPSRTSRLRGRCIIHD
jgi:hypothetical protein